MVESVITGGTGHGTKKSKARQTSKAPGTGQKRSVDGPNVERGGNQTLGTANTEINGIWRLRVANHAARDAENSTPGS